MNITPALDQQKTKYYHKIQNIAVEKYKYFTKINWRLVSKHNSNHFSPHFVEILDITDPFHTCTQVLLFNTLYARHRRIKVIGYKCKAIAMMHRKSLLYEFNLYTYTV